ncbi:hypothetical protein, partial [Burkholderia pseudomallei]|uniref:hypothetical protein n=1 Tax=Burkholderia pseudomallei TaxID=28450 RepID=UPI001E2C46C8
MLVVGGTSLDGCRFATSFTVSACAMPVASAQTSIPTPILRNVHMMNPPGERRTGCADGQAARSTSDSRRFRRRRAGTGRHGAARG